MAKKYVLKSPIVNKDDSLTVGEEISLSEDEALAMHRNGDIEVEEKELKELKAKEEQAKEKEVEKQNELEALLQRDELEAEKKTIQARLKEIEKVLKPKAKK